MKSKFFMYLVPILSTFIICLMSLFPEKIVYKFPSVIKLFTNLEKNSFKDYIPAIPTDPLSIWKLSQLEYSLKEIEKNYSNDLNKKKELTEKLINQAIKIAGTGKMNAEILHKLPKYLEDIEKNSVLSRIKGFFSFVNLIWMIAILGILISFGPVLFLLIKPFLNILILFWNNTILPIIIFLHKIGFFEFLGYFVSIILIADGMKANKEWGFFISLTGAGFMFLLFIYSLEYKFNNYYGLEFSRNKKYSKKIDKQKVIIGILTGIIFFSLSLVFNSKLLSFLTTTDFYFLIGFYTGCFGLCYFVGFLNKSDMYRVVSTSFCLMIFYIILRCLNINNQIIELYRSPIQIFGALTYFLGLLIISSLYFDEINLTYIQRQIIFIISLILVIFSGLIFNMPSLTNTTYVFGVLYLMEKTVEIFHKIEGNIYVLILILSIALWIFSLHLHKHSEIIISIMNGS